MNKKQLFFIIFFSILSYLVYGTVMGDPAWERKVSKRLLDKLATGQKAEFVVYMKYQYIAEVNDRDISKQDKAVRVFEKLRSFNLRHQSGIAGILDAGGYRYHGFFIVNAIAVKGDMDLVKRLAEREDVGFIADDTWIKQDNYTGRKKIVKRDPPENTTSITWGIDMIKADSVWSLGFAGAGAVVGGQDTGYDWQHPALKSKYRGYLGEDVPDHNYNWHDAIHEISPLNNDSIIDPSNNPCGLNSLRPCDDQGHGTHTMGTMVGGVDSLTVGVAPDAKWIGCRNMERGWGKPSTYIECFEWFLAPTDLSGENPDPAKSPDVINNSWSCPLVEGCDSTNWQYMEIALNNLRASGVFIVVSAGNRGIWHCGTINTPAAIFEKSFTVGATRLLYDPLSMSYMDVIANFSSVGPVLIDHSNRLKPDITAPGQTVFSCFPGNAYGYASGTSMAGPHVAGVVALMISANPALKGNPDAIAEILINTADPKPHIDTCRGNDISTVPNFVYGYGRINALKAVKEALRMKKSADFDSNDVILYPNPAKDYINIDFDNVYKDFTIAIFDVQGRLITRYITGNIKKLDISALSKGVYFLMLKQESITVFKKFIKL